MEQLVPEVLQDASSRERKLAVCASAGNLAPADHAEILVLLSTDADPVVAEQASKALGSQPVEAFVEALKRSEALPAIFESASQHLVGKPAVAEAMVQNRNCPSRFITPHVPQLSAMSVQALMDSLDRVRDSSELAAP